MSPEQSAEYLKTDENIFCAHSESANEGQTEAPPLDTDIDLHFIAFIQKDGHLYELDGAKEGPINHGPCGEDLLEVNQRYMLIFLKIVKFKIQI
jgi:ubiquitin carboxyl-terminal hydrolase L3